MKSIFIIIIFFLLLFPGGARGAGSKDEVAFSGYTWRIKQSDTPVGPGPNIFGWSAVRMNAQEELILSIVDSAEGPVSGEVFSKNYFYPGRFLIDFSLQGELDSRVVFGFFLYNESTPPFYNEIDFEIARWANPQYPNSQFSIQPYQTPGNSQVFSLPGRMDHFQAEILWRNESVLFTVKDESGETVEYWEYHGEDLPRSDRVRVHLNLWLFQGLNALGDGKLSVTIHKFSHDKLF